MSPLIRISTLKIVYRHEPYFFRGLSYPICIRKLKLEEILPYETSSKFNGFTLSAQISRILDFQLLLCNRITLQLNSAIRVKRSFVTIDFKVFDQLVPNDAIIDHLKQDQFSCHKWGAANQVEFEATKEQFTIIHK